VSRVLRSDLAKMRWYSIGLWQRVSFWLTVRRKLKPLKKQKQRLLENSRRGYKITVKGLGLDGNEESVSGGPTFDQGTVYLGEIDQDGYICAHREGLSWLPLVSREAFLPREKFKIFLVKVGSHVGIEKSYGNRIRQFLNELSALMRFNELGFNVPALLDYDLDKRTLTMAYVHGDVLREALASKGARLLDKHLGKQSDHPARQRKLVEQKRIDEGLRVMDQVIDAKGIAALHEQIRGIHAAGYVLVDIKYGNIILEKTTGKPFLVDFESAIRLDELYSRSAAAFLKKRDMDQFQRIFGLSKAG
jgi:tRNA A-37 threonylcarbamoyl transferase component Bud32